MHVYLVLGLVAALLGMAFISWIRRSPPHVVQPMLQRIALVVGAALLVFLAARTHWSVLGLAAIPLLQRLSHAYRTAKAAAGPTPGQVSEVETAFLRMSVAHDSGEMSGTVLQGEFAGQAIESMTLDELRKLRDECANDPQSVSVLEAFLDRNFDWREDSDPPRPSSGNMTRAEALEILDLTDGASDEDIVEAHRRLMQRVHPDRGGSGFLAAQINRAKDVLLSG
ncbi:MAG: molecular chaperone DnaJ [Pseudomonadota bacterium]